MGWYAGQDDDNTDWQGMVNGTSKMYAEFKKLFVLAIEELLKLIQVSLAKNP